MNCALVRVLYPLTLKPRCSPPNPDGTSDQTGMVDQIRSHHPQGEEPLFNHLFYRHCCYYWR